MLLIFLKFLAWLPLPLLHACAYPFGWLLYGLQTRHRYFAETNLALCFPELSLDERRQLARQSLVNTAKILLESPLLWLGKKSRVQQLVHEVSGESHLRQGLEKGKGVIFICPHLGNWEMAGLYISQHYAITSMFRPQRHKGMDLIIHQGRERFGANLVPSTNRGLRDLLRTLQKGGIIGALPDQNPGAGTGVFVPFFGVITYTPVFAARLARRTGATVINIWAERLARSKGFRIHLYPASEAIHDPDINTASASMNHDLETLVREKPEQYWWSYNRFRTRPEGEAAIYRSK